MNNVHQYVLIIYYGLDAMHGPVDWLVDKEIKSYLEVGGVKLRDIILRCIQTDFKRKLNQQTETKTDRYYFAGKEAILAQDETTFLNSVSLLCEVFEHLRLADGTVINVLAVRNQFLTDRFSCKQKWKLCVLISELNQRKRFLMMYPCHWLLFLFLTFTCLSRCQSWSIAPC